MTELNPNVDDEVITPTDAPRLSANVNDNVRVQAYAYMNALMSQMTGAETQEVVDDGSFVSVGQTALKLGVEKVLNTLSQVITRTIFASRPYSRKFPEIRRTEGEYGAMVRKISYCDLDFVENESYDLVDGTSLDMYEIRKPVVVEVRFYGESVKSFYITRFIYQINDAFTGPGQFMEFMDGLATELTNKFVQAEDAFALAGIRNFLAGKIAGDESNVIHVLTEYNTELGLTDGDALTITTVKQPENFTPFIKWLNARLASLSKALTYRSQLYHINITGKELNRHTPVENQIGYIYEPFFEQVKSMAMSGIYHDNYIDLGKFKGVPFWQSPDAPMSINTTPTYMDTDGTLITAEEAVNEDAVLGIIFDDQAIAYTSKVDFVSTTPLNSRGAYYNTWYNWTKQLLNDFTENAVVLLLD